MANMRSNRRHERCDESMSSIWIDGGNDEIRLCGFHDFVIQPLLLSHLVYDQDDALVLLNP